MRLPHKLLVIQERCQDGDERGRARGHRADAVCQALGTCRRACFQRAAHPAPLIRQDKRDVGEPGVDLCERIEVERSLRPPHGLLALQERGQNRDERGCAGAYSADAVGQRLCAAGRAGFQGIAEPPPFVRQEM